MTMETQVLPLGLSYDFYGNWGRKATLGRAVREALRAGSTQEAGTLGWCPPTPCSPRWECLRGPGPRADPAHEGPTPQRALRPEAGG